MAFPAPNLVNEANQQGIDPQARRILQLRQQKQDEHAAKLKHDRVQRETNALRARLAVVDREIERLTVSERRNKADVSRGKLELAKEFEDVREASDKLSSEIDRLKRIEFMVGKERNEVGRLRSDMQRIVKALEHHESELRRLTGEHDEHGSTLRQLKAKLLREQNEAKAKNNFFQQTLQRLSGKEQGIPALESERQKMQQKIKQLEDELRNSK